MSLGVRDLDDVDVGKYTKEEYSNDSSIPKYYYCWQYYILNSRTDYEASQKKATTILKSIIKKIADLGRSCDALERRNCTVDLRDQIWDSKEVKEVTERELRGVPPIDAYVLTVFARAIKTILDDAGFTCVTNLDKEAMKIKLEWSSSEVFLPKTHIRILPHENDLLPKLADLQKEGQFCDITLVVEGREFRVHSLVLAANSHVFQAMLLDPMKEAQTGKIKLEMKAKNLEKFLDLLYKGQTALAGATVDDLLDLLQAAHMYAITNIVKACELCMTGLLDADNIVNVYLFAKKRNHLSLCDLCKNYCTTHPELGQQQFDVAQIKGDDLQAMLDAAKDLKLAALQQAVETELAKQPPKDNKRSQDKAPEDAPEPKISRLE